MAIRSLRLPEAFLPVDMTQFQMVSSIRTPMLIQVVRLERTETNLMNFKWEVTSTHGNQPNTFTNGATCE